MNLPAKGDRYTRPGEPDVVITKVTDKEVSFSRGTERFTVSVEEFQVLLKNTIANSLKNITDETEV